jgi:DNA-binding transcriptional LysR family regulator
MAHHVLPKIIASIREREPDIHIDLMATDQSDNLLYREADIAVRMYRSEQLDIVTQQVGNLPMGIFAHETYLEKHGRPETFAQIWEMDVVGFDRNDLMLRAMRKMDINATRDWFSTRCDQNTVYFELIRAGCGIGFAACAIGEKDPGLVRLFPEIPLPMLPLWLAAPEVMRRTPRIRRVWDMLHEGLKPFVS